MQQLIPFKVKPKFFGKFPDPKIIEADMPYRVTKEWYINSVLDNMHYRWNQDVVVNKIWTVVGINEQEFLLIREGEVSQWYPQMFCEVIDDLVEEREKIEDKLRKEGDYVNWGKTIGYKTRKSNKELENNPELCHVSYDKAQLKEDITDEITSTVYVAVGTNQGLVIWIKYNKEIIGYYNNQGFTYCSGMNKKFAVVDGEVTWVKVYKL